MKTVLVSTADPEQASRAITQAVDIINGGGMVAFPTETVYGLAVNATIPAALERLAELKERPDHKPFTLHIGDKTEIPLYVPRMALLNRQLLGKAWPGPMTAVFALDEVSLGEVKGRLGEQVFESLYYEGTIGIRFPDHDIGRALLRGVGAPVVAPSANLAGKTPPTDAQDVLQQLDGKIDMVLDAGSTRYQQASTVVRLAGGDFEVLREGVLDAGTIQRMRSLTILFVCTGNSCRSPMAEGLCRKLLAERVGCSVDQLAGSGYKVMSAGVMAYEGGQASPEAVEACRLLGVDIGGHRAKPVTPSLLGQADVIFAMTRSHRRAILEEQPGAESRVLMLGGDQDVDDPIGSSLRTYSDCARGMEELLRVRLAALFDERAAW